eukprot:1408761-Pyramimonas_sp.AAC.1
MEHWGAARHGAGRARPGGDPSQPGACGRAGQGPHQLPLRHLPGRAASFQCLPRSGREHDCGQL